ncbi:hypothetical protein TPY_0406 [Sulfobacillus acidophilus TPY]|uniref:Helix-turn-helix domain protein n=1 Tax=Sulfobacillus acidophilus (strain ATCC 700253 / DSM 10332 / NAL) TaxID=679936 RepID=G8TY33_SULAD|nr:hypothetical protein TPY_0406 [Sulfobacillus acidophilus TPY]AEW03940.1 helix-turn-helix domain protein [Sulfobacillus acidophilus DSM 10332]
MVLSKYLVSVRRLKGRSTYDISAAAGVSQSQISKIERGVNRPSRDTLMRLSAPDAYGCPWLAADENATLLLGLADYWLSDREYELESPKINRRIMSVTAGSALIVERAPRVWDAIAGTTSLLALRELWFVLGIPAWKPPAKAGGEFEPSRPVWLWALWSADPDTVDTAVLTKNVHALINIAVESLATTARIRFRKGAKSTATPTPEEPNDADWLALREMWRHLSPGQRRLLVDMAREFRSN